MEGIHRILVVSRLTRYCRKAVRFGVSLAQAYGAELAVLHVVENPFKKGWNLPTIHYEDQYEKEMARVKAELDDIVASEKKKGMAIREFVEEGDPKEEILRVIDRERIDLLILTAHEEGRLEHFLYGRGIDGIIRRMPCSILLVRE
ncbi:MAG: Universal stress protein family protein [Syntrophaceae bacterium PtaB.Bin038]|nr:MAG: Universal stress protein family protein [Syntrophaceae bacterium PtaB.Bin038]